MIDQNQSDPISPNTAFTAYARRLCSVIGLALCLMYLLIQLVGIGTAFLYSYLETHGGTGFFAVLYKILDSEWFSTAGMSILAYCAALPPTLLLLRGVPEIKVEPKKMRIRKFIMFFVLAMGYGYIFNFLGNIINIVIAQFTSRSVNDMNPITEVMENMGFFTVLYLSVIGPVIEEFIFRKMLLNRVRPLGEKAAIIFTAVLFGLLHGNIAQFFYATFIGIILGYVAVKTGRIFYSSLLHILINSFSVIISLIMFSIPADNIILLGLFSLAVLIVTFSLVVSAVVILIINCKKTRLKRGSIPDGVEYRDFSSAMFLNPGVILFIVICVLMILFYAFAA